LDVFPWVVKAPVSKLLAHLISIRCDEKGLKFFLGAFAYNARNKTINPRYILFIPEFRSGEYIYIEGRAKIISANIAVRLSVFATLLC
jgi:hypothetical protein